MVVCNSFGELLYFARVRSFTVTFDFVRSRLGIIVIWMLFMGKAKEQALGMDVFRYYNSDRAVAFGFNER